jgi:hypothetical protein
MSKFGQPGYIGQQLDQFKINGFVVFEGFIPVEKVDRMREAFMPLLESVAQRNDPSLTRGIDHSGTGTRAQGQGRLQHPNRYTVEVPWQEPFADPEIYEHPVLLAFLDQLLGENNYLLPLYSSNNPYPGSLYQRWHRDNGLLSAWNAQPVPAGVGVKFPLVDTCEENGSYEVIPCTQYLADPGLEPRYDEIISEGQYLSQRLNLKKGDLWIQDPRTLHRGTPNRSDYPRPELVIAYYKSWYNTGRYIEMTQAEYDRLSERGKTLLKTCRITE